MVGVTFEEWYAALHPRLVATLTIVSGGADGATEAVDEAFVRAFEKWERVSLMASPAGWTYRTALNVLRRRSRRAAIEQRLLQRWARAAAAPPDWSPEVWQVLRALPSRELTAVACDTSPT
jgi:RNA polymerase sigma-70 factor (ECF subfamily)